MKRFDFSGNKLNNVIDFPETFQFPQSYMNDELAQNEKTGWTQAAKTSQDLMNRFLNRAEEADTFKTHSYELYGMIVHHGYNASSGHYYTLVRNLEQGWVKFDDDKVTNVDESQVKKYSEKAYLLFY